MAQTLYAGRRDVAMGIAHIFVADIAKIDATTDWTEIFETVKDSFSITQSPPEKAELFVDQQGGAVYTQYTDGTFEATMTVPYVVADILSKFFETDNTGLYAPTDMKATGVNLHTYSLRKMVQITFSNSPIILTLTNAEFAANFKKDAASGSPLSIELTLTALAPDPAGEKVNLIVYEPTV